MPRHDVPVEGTSRPWLAEVRPNGRTYTPAMRPIRQFADHRLRTAGRLLRSGRLLELARRILRSRRTTPTLDHDRWRALHVDLDHDGRRRLSAWSAADPGPTIALILSNLGDHPRRAVTTLASVLGQSSPGWDLALPADCGDGLLGEAGLDPSDPRIVRGRESVDGWCWHLEPGDILHEAAVATVAGTIARDPAIRAVTVDEDHVDDGGRFHSPHAKPAWNPDLLRGLDHVGRAIAFAPGLLDGPRRGVDAVHAQNARILGSLEPHQVRHLPHLLFSRFEPTRPAPLPHRIDVSDPPTRPLPRVSVLIPTRDQGRLLERCLRSVRDLSTWPDLELVVVDHQTTQRRARRVLDGLRRDPAATVLHQEGPFNFSAMVNRAAEAATGDVLCLLNNDTEVIAPDWLERMVGQLDRPGVGVVGALLLFTDGTIQHAGIHPGVDGLMGHGHKHRSGDDPGYFGRLTTPHEVAAVTGACLAVRREVFRSLGGLDAECLPVAYNDVDFCLRARSAGLRVVLEPRAVLHHHESVSRGFDDDPEGRRRLDGEVRLMRDRWGGALDQDPAYSPNLALDGGGFRAADPPRQLPPWAV